MSLCMHCGEIIMIEVSGIREPTVDEHIEAAHNGAIQQARQLWLDASNEATQESMPIVTAYKGLLYASRKTSETQRLILTGTYWRGAKAAYDTLLKIFNDENQTLPDQLIMRLELVGALIESGCNDATEELRDTETAKRKATSVRQH
jgi:hypothetical protein